MTRLFLEAPAGDYMALLYMVIYAGITFLLNIITVILLTGELKKTLGKGVVMLTALMNIPIMIFTIKSLTGEYRHKGFFGVALGMELIATVAYLMVLYRKSKKVLPE
jgi:hypothetical protein